MPLTPELVAALTGLVAVILSPAFAVWVSRRDRRAKVADYRKEIVEKLWESVSLFLVAHHRRRTATIWIRDMEATATKEESKRWHDERYAQIYECGRLYEYIRLCLNPEGKEHVEFESALYALMHSDDLAPRKVEGTTMKIIDPARKVLKREWARIEAELK